MPKTDRTIPPPSGDKEPLKTNVYQFIQNSVTALAPLFPYYDEGSIVPCVATFRGGPGVNYGRFQHFNTVDEVVILFGAQGGRGAPGFVRVGPKLHPVGAPFEDSGDPDSLRVTTITQRQLIGKPHREEYRFICDNCDRRLFLEKVDETPPKRGKQRETLGAHAPFLTIIETLQAAENYNADEDAHRCKNCGHQNDPFPIEAWGWAEYARQAEIVRMAESSIRAAQSPSDRQEG
jgi:hypothetical protein